MAKRFAFRLEPLLRLRRQREDEQKRVVAVRLRQIASLQRRQRKLETEIVRQTSTMREALIMSEIDVDSLKIGRHWIVRLRRGVLETDAEISNHRAMLAQERSVLAQASKETKVLGRLKDRRREVYMAELNRREQIEQDEMNALRFAHAVLTKDNVEL